MQIWLYCPTSVYSEHSSMIWPLPTSPVSFFTSLFGSCGLFKSDHLWYHFLSLCSCTYYFFWMKSVFHTFHHSAVRIAQLLPLKSLPQVTSKIDHYLFCDTGIFCIDIFIMVLQLFYFFGLSNWSPEIIYLLITNQVPIIIMNAQLNHVCLVYWLPQS